MLRDQAHVHVEHPGAGLVPRAACQPAALLLQLWGAQTGAALVLLWRGQRSVLPSPLRWSCRGAAWLRWCAGDLHSVQRALRRPGLPQRQQVRPMRSCCLLLRMGQRQRRWCARRFGQILGFAHAGMTAEGDNRVLMQKVGPAERRSITLLQRVMLAPAHAGPAAGGQGVHRDSLLTACGPAHGRRQQSARHLGCPRPPVPGLQACQCLLRSPTSKHQHSATCCHALSQPSPRLQLELQLIAQPHKLVCAGHQPAGRARAPAGGPRDLATLQRIFEARDGRRLAALVRAMAGAKGSEAVFDTWMRQESDAVQACARAYGEREGPGRLPAPATAGAPQCLSTQAMSLTLPAGRLQCAWLTLSACAAGRGAGTWAPSSPAALTESVGLAVLMGPPAARPSVPH